MIILSKDLQVFDNKIIVLYILSNSAKPLGITQIVKLCEEFDDITYLFSPFGIIMICIFLEIIYRIYNLTKRKKEKTEKYIKIDITIHLIELIALALYEIIFLINGIYSV